MMVESSVEHEMKFEIDRAGVDTLLSAGVIDKTVEQLNVYYDSSWQLADNASTFRVRFVPSKEARLTFKAPATVVSGVRMSQEIEATASSVFRASRCFLACRREIHVDRDLPEEFCKPLIALGVSTLERAGWMRNRRSVVRFQGVGSVEVDVSGLPNGQEFYEVEIENDNPVIRERIARLVKSIVRDVRVSNISKFQRFRRALEEKKFGLPLYSELERRTV
jgi:hypothetical protein